MKEAYVGGKDYIFFSYAHSDKDKDYPFLDALQKYARVWYDVDGIKTGDEWVSVLANKVAECTIFIAMLSDDYVRSDYCKRELQYAVERGRNVICVRVEKSFKESEDIRFLFGNKQHFKLYEYSSYDDAVKALLNEDENSDRFGAVLIDSSPVMGIVERRNADGDYDADNNFCWLGLYPQHRVTYELTLEELGKIAGKLPTARDNAKWKVYDFASNAGVPYMWYIDVKYHSFYYRGVYFDNYRPQICSQKAGMPRFGGDPRQLDNGYEKDNIYWFVYEPIKWRKIRTTPLGLELCSEYALDSRNYANSKERYDGSAIRAWLNDEFYAVAFNDVRYNLPVEVELDNDVRSANPYKEPKRMFTGINGYCCDNTVDRVYLPSVRDMTAPDTVYDEKQENKDVKRRKIATDYAQCLGVWISKHDTYKNNARWWLRSRSPLKSTAYTVQRDGTLLVGKDNEYTIDVTRTDIGVVPMITIAIDRQ